MSSDASLLLEVIPRGQGITLALGGSNGVLRAPLQERGYRYINLDAKRFPNGEPTIIGDAHQLCFKDETFSLVVSKCTLEHFVKPWTVVEEAYRVLKAGGRFVIWVPFMHPFHGDDFYRYSPLGLRHLLRAFDIQRFDSPSWVFTVMGLALIEFAKRCGLGWTERPIKHVTAWLDRRFPRDHSRPASFAQAYRIVARKPLGILL